MCNVPSKNFILFAFNIEQIPVLIFSSALLLLLLAFTLPGVRLDMTPPALVVLCWQALFDYSAGFGCEVEMDAWVGGCRWGARN